VGSIDWNAEETVLDCYFASRRLNFGRQTHIQIRRKVGRGLKFSSVAIVAGDPELAEEVSSHFRGD
jgi:hypothetical protein